MSESSVVTVSGNYEFEIPAVTANYHYQFKVRYRETTFPYATADSSWTPDQLLAFGAPQGVRVSKSGSTITLSWQPVTGAVKYRWYVNSTAAYGGSGTDTTSTSATITASGTQYFWVKAYADASGTPVTTNSAIVSATNVDYIPARPPFQTTCPMFPPQCPNLVASLGGLGSPMKGGYGAQFGDPVNVANGAENYLPAPDMVTPNKNGVPAVFSRSFRSGMAIFGGHSPGMSVGWSHNYDATLLPSPDNASAWSALYLRFPNGSVETITPTLSGGGSPTGAFTVTASTPIKVTGSASGTLGRWTWIDVEHKDETRWRFAYHSGSGLYVLSNIWNRVDHGIKISYNSDRTVYDIRDASSNDRLQFFTYGSDGLLDNILDYTDGVSSRVAYRRVYFRRQTYSAYGSYSAEGIHHSAVTVPVVYTVSASAAADRVAYTYVGRDDRPHLSTITVPSPTGTGTATATIEYETSQTGDLYRVSRLIDGNGNKTVFTYNTLETVIDRQDSSGTSVFAYTQKYDANNRATGIKDATSKETTIAYGTWGTADQWRVTTVYDAKSSPGTTSYTYDGQGNIDTITDPRGIVTDYDWDYTNFSLGRLDSVQEGSKGATSFSYDATTGLVTSITSPRPGGGTAVTTTYTYDSLGNVLTVTAPGNATASTMVTTYNYTTDGAYSQSARFGQPIRVEDPLGKVTSLRYDAEGNLTYTKDPLGIEYDYAFDIAGALTSAMAPATGQQGAGRQTANYSYLYMGGPLSAILLYDENSALVRTVTFGYGQEGEALSVSGGEEDTTRTYDAAYRLKTFADALGQTTTYNYNSRGLPSSTVYPGSNTVTYTSYDDNGNLTSMTDPNGLVRDYTYTGAADYLTDIEYPSLSGKDVTIGYDSYGRPTSKTDKAGSYSWTYGDLDEVLTETTTYTGLSAKTLTFTYNPDGSRASLALSSLGTFAYGYNGRGEMDALTDPYSATHSWTYLDNGWLWKQTLGNGAQTVYTYNDLGQRTDVTNRQTAGGTLLSQFTAGNRDGLANLLSLTASVTGASAYSGTTTWTYDTQSRLTQEASTKQGGFTHPYAFDAAGNLTHIRSGSQNRTYNNKNQISNTGFGYSANGNATTFASNSATWDELDRMTAYGGSFTAEYRSDGLRSKKGSSKYFLYDGETLLAEMDGSGNITAVNIWGPNGLLARRESSTTTYYQFDLLGGTVNRLSTLGAVVGYHTQNAYGIPTNSPASTDPYQGRGAQYGYYRDSETGLYLCTYRYYDAINCRFLSRDPIGYKGGANLYRYVNGNPIGSLDPSGLDTMRWDIWDQFGPLREMYRAHISAPALAWAESTKRRNLRNLDWLSAGLSNSVVDLLAGAVAGPQGVLDFGSGVGQYAGKPDAAGEIAAWGDFGTLCSLGLAGIGSGSPAIPTLSKPYNVSVFMRKGASGHWTLARIDDVTGYQLFRLDYGKIGGKGVPSWLQSVNVLHYHRRGSGNIDLHRPWQGFKF